MSMPVCKYYDAEIDEFISSGCITLNYTTSEVWCACQHLTSFAATTQTFVPTINIIDSTALRDLTAENIFVNYPISLITVVVVHLITIVLLLLLPKPDDTPMLARVDLAQNKLLFY